MSLNLGLTARRHEISQRSGRQQQRRAARSGASHAAGATISPTRRELVFTGAFTWTPEIGNSGLTGLVLRRCARDRRLQYRIGLVPAEGGGQLRRHQRPPRHARAEPALVDRAVGAEPVRHRIMRRSRSTRRSRPARPPLRSSIRNSRAGGRSSPPSSPSRGPTASPAASASERTGQRNRALAGDGGGLFLVAGSGRPAVRQGRRAPRP